MSGRIEIDFDPGEGAVPRMVGLVERRGFVVGAVTMRAEAGEGALSLDLVARDPSRRLEVVAGQLRRLHEVRTVTVHPVQPGAA